MEIFYQLFGGMLAFVYHCFDRIVINGYLSGLSRPEHVVYFFRQVLGIDCITKEALAKRTQDYQRWVESYARNQEIPMEWAQPKVRKEDHVLPWQRKFKRANRTGVYFIFKSMEQGPTFRCRSPRYATGDPNYRIVSKSRSRYTHYYFYILDEVLGPMGMRVGSFFPFPTTYYLNGHHTLRAYWKNTFVKQYEKFRTFLRQEVCSNNLKDFRLKKGLDNLPFVRTVFSAITERFISLQARTLNVHVDYPLFQQLAASVTVGQTKIAGIKIHDVRLVRLMEVLLHAGTQIAGWPMDKIHHAILTTYGLTADAYSITQLRYDMRKMKAHGLVQRNGKWYSYRLTDKGVKTALLFTFFHKRVCGPLAHSLFQHQPNAHFQPDSRLERAYHQADANIQKIIDLLYAA